jgi:hypothetical protein
VIVTTVGRLSLQLLIPQLFHHSEVGMHSALKR